MKKYLLTLGVVFLVVLTACTQQTQTTLRQEPTSIQPVQEEEATEEEIEEDSGTSMKVPAPGNEDVEEMVVVEGADESNIVEIDMIAKQWEFDPATVTVKKGSLVKLNIKSKDVAHGIAIPEFGVSERLEPGKEVTVEFTADKTGEFSFFCNVFCGKGHGSMRGTLIVE